MNSKRILIWVILAVLVAVMVRMRPRPGAPAAQRPPESPGSAGKLNGPSGNRVETVALKESEAERRARMISDSETNRADFKLSPQEVYAYVERSRSNALSLVVAFQLTEDREFLKAAAAKFPDNPMVQAQVVLFDLYPEERGKWIEALKQSAPENSFGNLLAARDAMKQGDVKGALAEVKAASGKALNDFTREAMQGLEEAYLSAGHTAADAKALGGSSVFLPGYAQIKFAGNQFVEAAKESADLGTKTEYLQANWDIGTQFRKLGEHGTLLADLVGLAMQNNTLRTWPAGTPAPFLDGTPERAIEANTAYGKDIKQGTGLFTKWFPTAPEFEIITYMDRTKTFGELDAINWLRQRHPELAQAPR